MLGVYHNADEGRVMGSIGRIEAGIVVQSAIMRPNLRRRTPLVAAPSGKTCSALSRNVGRHYGNGNFPLVPATAQQ